MIEITKEMLDFCENKRLREALTKLVELKEHKDKIGKDEYYHNNLLLVWNNAKKLMIKADAQPPKEQNND